MVLPDVRLNPAGRVEFEVNGVVVERGELFCVVAGDPAVVLSYCIVADELDLVLLFCCMEVCEVDPFAEDVNAGSGGGAVTVVLAAIGVPSSAGNDRFDLKKVGACVGRFALNLSTSSIEGTCTVAFLLLPFGLLLLDEELAA